MKGGGCDGRGLGAGVMLWTALAAWLATFAALALAS
jgi:hypothetical protein